MSYENLAIATATVTATYFLVISSLTAKIAEAGSVLIAVL